MPDKDVVPHPRLGRPPGYAKSVETRAALLAAALAEASERGLHKTSVARVATRAGAAVGTLNYHFGSRDELIRQMMAKLMADLFSRLAAADAQQGADFFERHRAELLAYVGYIRANPAHVRLTDEIKFLEPELYQRGVEEWVSHLAARLRAGIAEGSVRRMDEAEITAQAHFLFGARHFLEQMLGGADGMSDEDVVDAYLRLVRDGLGAGPRDERRRIR